MEDGAGGSTAHTGNERASAAARLRRVHRAGTEGRMHPGRHGRAASRSRSAAPAPACDWRTRLQHRGPLQHAETDRSVAGIRRGRSATSGWACRAAAMTSQGVHWPRPSRPLRTAHPHRSAVDGAHRRAGLGDHRVKCRMTVRGGRGRWRAAAKLQLQLPGPGLRRGLSGAGSNPSPGAAGPFRTRSGKPV